MNHEHTPDDDLWSEFRDKDTSIPRRVEILWNFGVREVRRHQVGEPLQYWLPALELARENQLRAQWIQLCDDLTRHHISNLKKYQTAIEYANEGLGLIPEFTLDSEERVLQAHITWGKAVAFDNMSRIDEAIFFFKQSAQMYGDVGNTSLKNTLISNLIDCYLDNQQFDEADALISEVRDYFQSEDNLYYVATVDSYRAHILVQKGRVSEGLDLFLEAHSVLEQIHFLEPKFIYRLALAYSAKQEYQKAKKFFKRAKMMGLNRYFDAVEIAIKATRGLADTYELLDQKDKAEKARFDASCIEARTAKEMSSESDKTFVEIEKLRKIGEYDLAMQLANEILHAQETDGNIKLHLRAACENLITLFFNKKYDEVLYHWDQLPKKAIDAEDTLAIKVKNMVVHSLFRCNRVEEARELCYQVVADIRLQSNRQEMAYAYENLAEIESDPELRKKHQSVAIESNLEANNPTRALQITRKFREEY
jgi:tetratricopeptide (TPR) repeat protein